MLQLFPFPMVTENMIGKGHDRFYNQNNVQIGKRQPTMYFGAKLFWLPQFSVLIIMAHREGQPSVNGFYNTGITKGCLTCTCNYHNFASKKSQLLLLKVSQFKTCHSSKTGYREIKITKTQHFSTRKPILDLCFFKIFHSRGCIIHTKTIYIYQHI